MPPVVQTAGTGITTLHDDVTTAAAEGVDLTTSMVVLDGLNIMAGGIGIARFNAPTELTTAASDIDTGGTITFENTLTSPGAGNAQNLTLQSDANIDFNDTVGAGADNALGLIQIDTAVNVEADGTIDAASLVQTAGTGTTTLHDDVTTNTATGVDLTTATVVLDGLNILAGGTGIARFNAPTRLTTAASDINSGGTITFENTLTSPGAGNTQNLTLESGANIDFNDAVGAGVNNALGAIQIGTAVNVEAASTVGAGSLVQTAGTGTTTLHDDVTTAAAEGVNLTTSMVVLDGLNIMTGGTGIARFNAPTQLTSAAIGINAGGTITFENMLTSPGVGSAQNLTLESDANIVFNDAVGAGVNNALGAMQIDTAVNVEAASTVGAASLVQTAGTGITTLHDDVTTAAAEGVDLTTSMVVLDGLNIMAGGMGIARFNAPTQLTSAAIGINSGGTITFENTLTSPGAGSAQNLTLESDANIDFNDAVGAGVNNALGAIQIDTAVNVEADSTVGAASLVQTAGTGITTLHDDVTTAAAEGVDLTTSMVVLDGLNIMAGGIGIARFNAPTELTTAASDIDTGGTITFENTLTSPGAGSAQNLTLASDANIDFNDSVGAGADNALGAMLINTAMNVEVDSTIEAASLAQTTGTGTTRFLDDVMTSAMEGVNIKNRGITLADTMMIDAGIGDVMLNATDVGGLTLGDNTLLVTDDGQISGVSFNAPDPLAGSQNIGSPLPGASAVAKIAIRVVDSMGENLVIVVDWREGDPPPPPVPVPVPPENLRAEMVTSLIDGMMVTEFRHQYAANPEPDPSDDINVTVTITDFAQGSIILVNGNAVLLDDRYEVTIVVPVRPPDTPTIAQLPEPEPLPTPFPSPPTVETSFEFTPADPRQGTSLQVENTPGVTSEQDQRYYELRIVSFDENGKLIELKERINLSEDSQAGKFAPFELSKLPELFERLPDDRYRLYLIEEDRTERLVLEFLIRQGRPVEAPEVDELNQDADLEQLENDGQPAADPGAGNGTGDGQAAPTAEELDLQLNPPVSAGAGIAPEGIVVRFSSCRRQVNQR